VVKIDEKEKRTKLSLRAFDILDKLETPERDYQSKKTE
jgi:glutamate--cysteine ligase catalytic subunit